MPVMYALNIAWHDFHFLFNVYKQGFSNQRKTADIIRLWLRGFSNIYIILALMVNTKLFHVKMKSMPLNFVCFTFK